jgi:hypothetical protein
MLDTDPDSRDPDPQLWLRNAENDTRRSFKRNLRDKLVRVSTKKFNVLEILLRVHIKQKYVRKRRVPKLIYRSWLSLMYVCIGLVVLPPILNWTRPLTYPTYLKTGTESFCTRICGANYLFLSTETIKFVFLSPKETFLRTTVGTVHCKTVLGIRDILVQIRIRIPRSVPLTNGSGSSSGSNSGSDSFPDGTGSGRPKNMRILRIRIRFRVRIPNTAVNEKFFFTWS